MTPRFGANGCTLLYPIANHQETITHVTIRSSFGPLLQPAPTKLRANGATGSITAMMHWLTLLEAPWPSVGEQLGSPH